MMTREDRILNLLMNSPKGCNRDDFSKHEGLTHYGDAVLNLKARGYDIDKLPDRDKKGVRVARYFYKGYSGKVQSPKEKKETKRNQAIKLALEGMNFDNKELRLFASRVYNLLK